METKSRYQVISELEEKKRELIMQRDGLDKSVKTRQNNIKNVNRQLEDMEEELTYFKESLKEQKETFAELIASVEDSLERMNSLSQKKQ